MFSFIDYYFINWGIFLKGNYLKLCLLEWLIVNIDICGFYLNCFNLIILVKLNVLLLCG